MSDVKKYSNKLLDKRILIIGGSSGIGFAVAEASVEFGARVIISSSQTTRINNAKERLLKSYPSAESRISGHACDLSTAELETNIQKLLEESTNKGSEKLDHIIFTATNKLQIKPLEEVNLEGLQQAAMMRYNAALLLAKHARNYLNAGPASSITLTSGVAAEKPMKDWSMIAGYTASVYGMVRSLSVDLAPLRVNVVSPGAVLTELWDSFPKEAVEKMTEGAKVKSTTGTIGKPEDVAEAYLYCMRDYNLTASNITTNSGCLLT